MLKFGLIGKSLGHSFSKPYHNERFQREGYEARYDNYELSDASSVIALFQENPDLHGVNVTIPFKTKVMQYLDDLDDDAREVAAVNTIARSGIRLIGFNTDVYGFEVSLSRFMQDNVEQALVLGTGGASKAVGYVLMKMNINYLLVSRRQRNDAINYDDVTPELIETHKLIINCTPLGMAPDTGSLPGIPYHAITTGHFVFDLVYNPRKTLFLERSEERGAHVKNGLEMLHLQADRSWEIWQSYLDNENEGS